MLINLGQSASNSHVSVAARIRKPSTIGDFQRRVDVVQAMNDMLRKRLREMEDQRHNSMREHAELLADKQALLRQVDRANEQNKESTVESILLAPNQQFQGQLDTMKQENASLAKMTNHPDHLMRKVVLSFFPFC